MESASMSAVFLNQQVKIIHEQEKKSLGFQIFISYFHLISTFVPSLTCNHYTSGFPSDIGTIIYACIQVSNANPFRTVSISLFYIKRQLVGLSLYLSQ